MTIALRSMATDIRSFEELDRLTHINHVPIPVIEHRARTWSTGGFLRSDESLINVLKKDWKTVDSLGLTHVEIAEHVNKIIRKACKGFGGVGYADEQNEISYEFNEVSSAKLPDLMAQMQKATYFQRFGKAISERKDAIMKASGVFAKVKALIESFMLVFKHTFFPPAFSSRIRVCVEGYGGHQEDIFKDGERRSYDGAVVDEYQWCRDYVLTNCDTGKSIRVAYGVLEYIKRFGFYEGEVEYRVDPRRLLSVLTGRDFEQ